MNTNAKKPVPAVERMRRLRARRRNGFRSLRVLLHDMEIDSLEIRVFETGTPAGPPRNPERD